MKARPILFSAPMVSALLEGRKTQTRRIVKGPDYYGCLTGDCPHEHKQQCADSMADCCPYGKPGELLWVRETWGYEPKRGGENRARIVYRADMTSFPFTTDQDLRAMASSRCLNPPGSIKWRPSIHMPRKASRLTLKITDVRVQRLQQTSQEDAIAEGINVSKEAFPYGAGITANGGPWSNFSIGAFADLWDAINGPGAWDANPWVWAITFEVIKANVGAVMKTRTPTATVNTETSLS